ncbi:asparagine synthase (glutamine-hydrolyzing) [Candidatus Pacearchaeota archaeon]|nr:asparagine synthase (glutamine-hydrolyzing) [Candidatus Pacearchaeota archaeon]
MCGINGFNFNDKELIKKMNESIYHRGPDQGGYYVNHILSLGMRRLKIIDLSEKARQPMSDKEKSIWIVFNGEIYNYKEIRKELEKKYKFNSQSDTEIIIYAYKEWGYDCVNKFNGMWAFCIYDSTKNILFLSRDRFGKKPLYYYNKNKFIFSSEIKAILKHDIKKELDKKAISSFLSYRYVLGEETFFENIFKLLPGHNLVYNIKDKKVEKIWEYWDLSISNLNLDEHKAKQELEKLLKKSISLRKISDVPLGVILSGGLDSSLITAILAKQEPKINTFTVKFKEKGYDETEYAKIVSNNYKTNHHEVIVDTANFLDIMKEYTKFKDEPIGVPNEIALFLLSKKIKEKVTVVLSGEGADEIFEGYGRKFSSARDYEIIKKIKQLNNPKIYKTKFISLFKKYNGKLFNSEIEHFLYEYKYWTEEEKNAILNEEFKSEHYNFFEKYMNKFNIPYQKKISYLFIKIHLPGLLNRLDSPTMACSVEGRAPFLDPELVQFAFNLTSSLKTKWTISENEIMGLNEIGDNLSERKNISKYLLKEVAKDYLPKKIIYREKQGFPLPLNDWFKEDFIKISKDLLLDKNSKIKPIANQDNLKKWIEERDADAKRSGQKLWMLLSLELWLREWM